MSGNIYRTLHVITLAENKDKGINVTAVINDHFTPRAFFVNVHEESLQCSTEQEAMARFETLTQ